MKIGIANIRGNVGISTFFTFLQKDTDKHVNNQKYNTSWVFQSVQQGTNFINFIYVSLYPATQVVLAYHSYVKRLILLISVGKA